MIPRRGDLWWVRLDPTEGSEIRKTRPCLILTADSLNRLRRTVVVVLVLGAVTLLAPAPAEARQRCGECETGFYYDGGANWCFSGGNDCIWCTFCY